MIGIPFEIRRFSERGAEMETVFLRSRRRGPEGVKMRQAISSYRRAQLDQARLASKVGLLTQRFLSALGADEPAAASPAAGAALEAEQTAGLSAAADASEEALRQAELIAQFALQENHGDDTDRIVGMLTDRELHAIVATVEQGGMPKDFFPSAAIPPSANAISPSGVSPAKPSPPPDGTTRPSSPGESTSKTA